ncbi:tRNA(Ile)-lysidine synthase [Ensifer sp. M14]|uniref:tRNA lysidine(34) synthetase TilS n=1 Tax=Ensifer sp. M14 TaxID=2203782 RepID=UPI000E2B3E3B|nr:tRNA lysidine(34) synthetase TilS [Ensifer sp. M14]RDL50191.1 tRNA(Ile)-lysidine synthase [Ensifer sp. M14]
MAAETPTCLVVLETAKRFLSSFHRPARLLVAVSGGSDSKGLLLALNKAIEASGNSDLSLAACTVDHALRPGSADEADAVAGFCASLGIAHIVKRWDGQKPAAGIQAAAREKRYQLLAEAADNLGATCIVTGHTLDDQRETILMRSERGQGPGGAGMAADVLYDRRFWVLRPFLRLHRADVRAFLAAEGEGWFDDPSNANARFERVRTRVRLAETGEEYVSTWDAASRARSSEAAARWLGLHARVHENLVVSVSCAAARGCGDIDCRRGLLALAGVVGGRTHSLAADTVARLVAFLVRKEPGRLTAGRVVFDKRATGLYLYREARDLPTLALRPAETGVWDGRFTVRNGGNGMVQITTTDAGGLQQQRLIAAGVPPGVAKRAALSAPHVVSTGDNCTAKAAVEPRICPYDTFLPGFDRIMAEMIAGLFGRQPYVRSPVHDLLTEMER